MIYRLAADAVTITHLLFIVFVVAGGLLVLRWPKLAWVHLPCAAYGVLIEWVGWVCPLTPLENHFRELAGANGYETGFVEHYLLPIIYPGGLTPTVQFALGALVLATNAAIYAYLWRHRRRRH